MYDITPFEDWERMKTAIVDTKPDELHTIFESLGDEYLLWYETFEIPAFGSTAQVSVERFGTEALIKYLDVKSFGVYE